MSSGSHYTSLTVVLMRYIWRPYKTYQILCFPKKIASQYFHTMRISAAATASPRAWQIPLQHWVRYNRPHRNIACDHPAAWFGQIRRIL
jgi:hypothetical protein